MYDIEEDIYFCLADEDEICHKRNLKFHFVLNIFYENF